MVGRWWGGGGEVVGRWWGGGGEVVGRWWGGGGEVVGRWWGGGGEVVGRWWGGGGEVVGNKGGEQAGGGTDSMQGMALLQQSVHSVNLVNEPARRCVVRSGCSTRRGLGKQRVRNVSISTERHTSSWQHLHSTPPRVAPESRNRSALDSPGKSGFESTDLAAYSFAFATRSHGKDKAAAFWEVDVASRDEACADPCRAAGCRPNMASRVQPDRWYRIRQEQSACVKQTREMPSCLESALGSLRLRWSGAEVVMVVKQAGKAGACCARHRSRHLPDSTKKHRKRRRKGYKITWGCRHEGYIQDNNALLPF